MGKKRLSSRLMRRCHSYVGGVSHFIQSLGVRSSSEKHFPIAKRTIRFANNESGAVLPFAVLTIVGGLIAISYAVDTSRMIHSSSQVKRAADSAAMAIGNQALLSSNKIDLAQLQKTAQGYVVQNLGMDSALRDQINDSSITVTQSKSDEKHYYTVSVALTATSDLLNAEEKDQVISSTVEVVSLPTEVALMLPNSIGESDADLSALRKVSKRFARDLLGEESGKSDQKMWLSLVPYSQSVNVYDYQVPDRINHWAALGALTPIGLRSLFRSGKLSDLADPRNPNLKDPLKLLCLGRGLGPGQNYFWDRAPTNSFTTVYFRADLPLNNRAADYPIDSISWRGPHPEFGGPDDTRVLIADRGCPKAALLPLTNDITKIEKRLDKMRKSWNINYGIGMSWAGAALSPAMRGANGWKDNELPLDFSKDKNVKVIVMLANTKGDWFDTDSYNFNKQDVDNFQPSGEREFAKQRFIDLCRDFRSKHIKFYFIGVRPGDPNDFGRGLFTKVAAPGLRQCVESNNDLYFADASTFSEARGQIQSSLDKIANSIRANYYARLIK